MSGKISILRVFFGIPVLKKDAALFVRTVLEQYPELDEYVRWVKSGNFHVTVRFIGNIKAAELDSIIAAVKPITEQMAPFSVQVEMIDHFPSPKSGILAGIVSVSRPFVTLYEKLDTAMAGLGFASENRTFKPHITLCRRKGKLSYRITPITLSAYELHLHELVLYKSQPEEGGNVYIPLQRFPLKRLVI